MISKKKKKKKKTDHEICTNHLVSTSTIAISTPQEIMFTFPHPPVFSNNGFCLGVAVKPISLLC